jgi:hypothetical protein
MKKLLLISIAFTSSLFVNGFAQGQVRDFTPIVPGSQKFSNIVRVQCESFGRRIEKCTLPFRTTRIERQRTLSRTSCTGRVRGLGESYVEVRDGCRAIFKVTLESPVRTFDIDCQSTNRSVAECAFLGGPSLAWVSSRFSRTGCSQLIDWRVDNALPQEEKVVVYNGCRARFTIYNYPS